SHAPHPHDLHAFTIRRSSDLGSSGRPPTPSCPAASLTVGIPEFSGVIVSSPAMTFSADPLPPGMTGDILGRYCDVVCTPLAAPSPSADASVTVCILELVGWLL